MSIAGTETHASDALEELVVVDGGGDDRDDDAAPLSDAASDSADAEADTDGSDGANPPRRWRTRAARVLAYIILPAVALLLAAAAGYLKWVDATARDAEVFRAQSVQAAIDSTVATHDVVIPGAKQRQISAVATVPAAASVSATANHAVVLVFVNQSTIIGNDPPSDSTSSVRVTLEKVHDRWLISQFDPV